jgi:hypothetical protein
MAVWQACSPVGGDPLAALPPCGTAPAVDVAREVMDDQSARTAAEIVSAFPFTTKVMRPLGPMT